MHYKKASGDELGIAQKNMALTNEEGDELDVNVNINEDHALDCGIGDDEENDAHNRHGHKQEPHDHDGGGGNDDEEEAGLYDDVMGAPTPNLSMSDSANNLSLNLSATTSAAAKPSVSAAQTLAPSQTSSYTKRVSCYIGNLTWWTTDKDLTEAIKLLGVADLLEIKFYENKVNGQSKGFCLCTVGSDASFRLVMDKLGKQEINGQAPMCTHFSRHFFNQFEEQARKDMASTAGGGGGGGGGGNQANGSLMDHQQQQSQYHGATNPHHFNSGNAGMGHQQSQQQPPFMSMFKIILSRSFSLFFPF